MALSKAGVALATGLTLSGCARTLDAFSASPGPDVYARPPSQNGQKRNQIGFLLIRETDVEAVSTKATTVGRSVR
jgi:hypothetical protein